MTKYRTKEQIDNFQVVNKITYYFLNEESKIQIMFKNRFIKLAKFCYKSNNWNYLLDEVVFHIMADFPTEITEILVDFHDFLLKEIVEEYNPELEKLDTIIELLKGKR